MTVWYCNHYAMPPGAGGAVRPVRLAEGIRGRGGEATVIAAGWHHLYRESPRDAPGPRENRIVHEDGIRFCFVGARPYGGNGFGRLRNMADYASGLKRMLGCVRNGELEKPDVIVYSSPHPFGAGAASVLAREFGARFILEERDLWPESLIEVAGARQWHPLCLWAGRCIGKARRNADAFIGVLPGVGKKYRERGFGEKEVTYIPNGSALGTDDHPGENPYRDQFAKAKSEGKFVVAYTGSLGVANDLDQILDLEGAVEAKDRDYHFFLIGDGGLRPHLERRVAELGIGFVTVLPAVPKALVPAILQDADAGVVVWKKLDLYRFGVSPNKVFDYLLASLPVLWVGETEPDPIREAGAGWTVPPEDGRALHEALTRAVATGADERARMGKAGYAYLKANHDWEDLGGRFFDLCRRMASR